MVEMRNGQLPMEHLKPASEQWESQAALESSEESSSQVPTRSEKCNTPDMHQKHWNEGGLHQVALFHLPNKSA